MGGRVQHCQEPRLEQQPVPLKPEERLAGHAERQVADRTDRNGVVDHDGRLLHQACSQNGYLRLVDDRCGDDNESAAGEAIDEAIALGDAIRQEANRAVAEGELAEVVRELAILVVVLVSGDADLLEVVLTLGSRGGLADLLDSGEQQPDQYCDNRNNDQ